MIKKKYKKITARSVKGHLWILLVFLFVLSSCSQEEKKVSNEVYYIDSELGNDENDGSIDHPIATLDAVNQLPLEADDQVLFKRGTTYRGQLFPASGFR